MAREAGRFLFSPFRRSKCLHLICEDDNLGVPPLTFFANHGGVLSDDFTYFDKTFDISPMWPRPYKNQWYLFTASGALLADDDAQYPRAYAPSPVDLALLKTAIDVEAPLALMVGSSRVDVKEGGTAAFRVKLSEAPAADLVVAVSRRSGDTDLTITSGASLTFTTTTWNTWQEVVLAAAADADSAIGTAVFELSASLSGIPATVLPDGKIRQLIQAYEVEGQGATTQAVVTGFTYMGVPKGGSLRLGVHLARDPGAVYALTAERSATNDVFVVGDTQSLTFDGSNWWRMQYVEIGAKNTVGTAGQAVLFKNAGITLGSLLLYAVDADPAKSGGAGLPPSERRVRLVLTPCPAITTFGHVESGRWLVPDAGGAVLFDGLKPKDPGSFIWQTTPPTGNG